MVPPAPSLVAGTQEVSCYPGAFSVDSGTDSQLLASVGAWGGSGVCRSGSRVLGDLGVPHRPCHVGQELRRCWSKLGVAGPSQLSSLSKGDVGGGR